MVFETPRLIVRKSAPRHEDARFLYGLWTNPEVMTFVGFPKGLRITLDDVRMQLAKQGPGEYDCRLLVVRKDNGETIGECKLGAPDADGVSETDVKLMPAFWGQHYGSEIKRGLVDYLFANTDCRFVKATPNRSNVASQKMQESVGGKRVGEGVFVFPEKMRNYTIDVPYYEYRVSRENWTSNRTQ